MGVNRRRGEVGGVLDGRERRLCLTLGALAELEDAFAVGDLGSLAERFAGGRMSARDITRIIGAGLRACGEDATDEEVAAMRHDDGIAGMASLAGELLAATFGPPPAGAQSPDP